MDIVPAEHRSAVGRAADSAPGARRRGGRPPTGVAPSAPRRGARARAIVIDRWS